jgi:hypothetical protein
LSYEKAESAIEVALSRRRLCGTQLINPPNGEPDNGPAHARV